MLQMNPDGGGNVGTVTFSGYIGQNGASKGTASYSNVKYIFSGGAGVVTFPNSNTALFTGQYYLYFSPDGNFVFGGSPVGFDMFVGVRTGTGTPNLNGLYYEAGLDQDTSTLNAGYASLDTFYGAFSASGGNIVAHQRLQQSVQSLGRRLHLQRHVQRSVEWRVQHFVDELRGERRHPHRKRNRSVPRHSASHSRRPP